MRYLHNKKLVPIARELRKNMTPEEKKLWYQFLNQYPVHFQRQKIIRIFVADFYCAKAALVIELDGSQHYEEQGLEKDSIRDEFFKEEGLLVLRFSNRDVNEHFEAVCALIDRTVRERIK